MSPTLARENEIYLSYTAGILVTLLAAGLLLECAAANGCGRDIEFEWIGADPRDPYGFVNAGEQAVARIAAAKRA